MRAPRSLAVRWLLAATAVLLLVALLPPAAPARAATVLVSPDGERLLDPSGRPLFVVGVNYEGPADRAWKMWDDGQFDPALIAADLDRAQAAGVNVVRIFLQSGLLKDLQAGRWTKLDTVLGLARERGLLVIFTFADYAEHDLTKLAATAAQVARRYRDHPAILAYDLKNEPRYGDLAAAQYPPGVVPPLRTDALIKAYGEKLKRSDVPAYRQSDAGAAVPERLSDDEAYYYINGLKHYQDFLAEAGAWVAANGYLPSTADYWGQPEAAKWGALRQALDGTLAAWLKPLVEAVRSADPIHPITVGYSDQVLARLPANRLLDYHTVHRYPNASAQAFAALGNLLRGLKAAFPGRPVMLGEYGFANDQNAPARTAVWETAALLQAHELRLAGALKWMLNDFPLGFNARQNSFGMYRGDGSAKPIVAAFAALRGYLAETGAAPGDLSVAPDPEDAIRYTYRAEDALFLSGRAADAGALRFQAEGPAQLFVSWWEPDALRIVATARAELELDPDALVGRPAAPGAFLTRLEGAGFVPQTATKSGARVRFTAEPGVLYRYILQPGGPRAQDYPIPGGRFYTQANGRPPGEHPAGFSVSDADGIPFWTTYQELGGPDALGYPVTRRFQMDGFVVQAFQKVVFQWRPEVGQVWFLNTFDALHDAGKDEWLLVRRQTPPPEDTRPDTGLPWDQVVARHLQLLDREPRIKARFLEEPAWLERYGLPMSYQDFGPVAVLRAQRATFQLWKTAMPWAAAGTVTVANGGDLAKEAGLFPWEAVTPENAPR